MLLLFGSQSEEGLVAWGFHVLADGRGGAGEQAGQPRPTVAGRQVVGWDLSSVRSFTLQEIQVHCHYHPRVTDIRILLAF